MLPLDLQCLVYSYHAEQITDFMTACESINVDDLHVIFNLHSKICNDKKIVMLSQFEESSRLGCLPIAAFLATKLTVSDMRANDNFAFHMARENGHASVV